MNMRLFRAGSMAAALAALCVSLPAFADGHGHGNAGGGGFAGARGGSSMAHGAAPPGGRMGMSAGRSAGFSGPRSFGGPSNFGGQRSFGGPTNFAGPRNFGGQRAIGPSAFAGGRVVGAPAGRSGYAPSRVYSSQRFNGASGFRPTDRNFAGRASFNRPLHAAGAGWRPRYWAGGNFRGGYWPRSYFHSGFAWFVPVLPAFYSTFWFGGLPYYYWDDTYYTWSSSDSGYIATDPPPAVDSDASDGGSAQVQSSDSSSLYIYPKNGQSEEQTSTDRYECHQWAASQTGFDPTNGANQSAASNGPSDYRRAMSACLDARGYSAR